MKALTILAALLSSSLIFAKWQNNPPVSGKRPVYTVGTPKQGIDILVVYDLICIDSKEGHPEFQRFLNMTWNVTNTQVKNEIEVSYSYLPLTYHHNVWPVHKLIPYILDNCDHGPHQCIFMDYMEYCFENLDDILNKYQTSMNSFIDQWSTDIASRFDYPVEELLDVFDDDLDTHNSEMRTRYMFKWRTFRTQSGTPFAYVNGVLLEKFPHKAEDWMEMLQTVYNSQYRPS